MPFPTFDRSRLRIQPLAKRQNDLDLSVLLPLDAEPPPFDHPALSVLGRRLVEARRQGRARILLMGAHVLRAGVARHLIDLMERGLVDHLAFNGAGPIHDWEFALIGASTESVARYIQTGEFGLWEETGRMNDVIRDGARAGLGLGEALGRAILDGPFPHKEISVLAAAARLGVPATVHVGVGYDILHEHPNCDGAALGETSYRDFLVFAADGDAPGGRRAAQLRLRRHGAGGLPQGAGDGPQRRPAGGPRNPPLHHRRLRPRAARRRHAAARRRRPTRATTTALGRPFWCAPWRTVGKASICKATTAPPCRTCAGPPSPPKERRREARRPAHGGRDRRHSRALASPDDRRAGRPVPRPLPRHRRRPDGAVAGDRPGRLPGDARALLSRRRRHGHQQPGGPRRGTDYSPLDYRRRRRGPRTAAGARRPRRGGRERGPFLGGAADADLHQTHALSGRRAAARAEPARHQEPLAVCREPRKICCCRRWPTPGRGSTRWWSSIRSARPTAAWSRRGCAGGWPNSPRAGRTSSSSPTAASASACSATSP